MVQFEFFCQRHSFIFSVRAGPADRNLHRANVLPIHLSETGDGFGVEGQPVCPIDVVEHDLLIVLGHLHHRGVAVVALSGEQHRGAGDE